MALRDRVEPIWTKSRIEVEDPRRPKPNTETVEPALKKLVMEIDEPR